MKKPIPQKPTRAPATIGGTGEMKAVTECNSHQPHTAIKTNRINTMGTPGRVNTCRSFMAFSWFWPATIA